MELLRFKLIIKELMSYWLCISENINRGSMLSEKRMLNTVITYADVEIQPSIYTCSQFNFQLQLIFSSWRCLQYYEALMLTKIQRVFFMRHDSEDF